MQKRRMMVAAAAVSLIFSAHAFGSDERGFYIGAGFGKATNEVEDEIRGANFDDSETSYGFLAGYSLANYFAIETAYLDAGTVTGTIGPYAYERETSSVTVSALGTWPIGRWGLSLKLGYAFTSTDQSVRLGNQRNAESNSSEEVAGGVAVSFSINPRYSVRAEYAAVLLDGGTFNNLSVNGIFKF